MKLQRVGMAPPALHRGGTEEVVMETDPDQVPGGGDEPDGGMPGEPMPGEPTPDEGGGNGGGSAPMPGAPGTGA
jgi:hypothetical protein